MGRNCQQLQQKEKKETEMKKQDFSKLNTYEVVLEEELSDIASIGTLLKHKRTGARGWDCWK